MHLLLYGSILLTASAVYVPLQTRVSSYDQEVQNTEPAVDVGRTTNEPAGVGAEFEAPFLQYKSQGQCSSADTDAAKGKAVVGRTGTYFKLTGDGIGQPGTLNAEYILNGEKIKVGSGEAAQAGADAAADLLAFLPKGTKAKALDIADNKCNPWDVSGLTANYDPNDVEWGPQITAPMPLEAVYFLMKENLEDPNPPNRNILDGFLPRDSGLVVVTQAFFQSNPNGIDGTKVTDDVLGFCSLVLSYAKSAGKRNSSPKMLTTFMPRTEFNTIFLVVKSKLPGDLYTLFNILACYKNEDASAVLDTDFCTGSAAAPKPKAKFAGLAYQNSITGAQMSIKNWIVGIGSGSPEPDLLSKFDESFDKSIGGLGTKMEKIFDSQRSAPLFEFRDLMTVPTSKFAIFMGQVDDAIQKLHKTFATAPQENAAWLEPSSGYLPNPPQFQQPLIGGNLHN